jgi:cell fate regulator YaaT (PSP1 superfamily)
MMTEQVYAVGQKVVVQGKRGPEVATVRGEPETMPQGGRYGMILQEASPEDLTRWAELGREAEDLKWLLRARARARELPVKIVAAEYTLDASLLTVSYSAEERIELSALIQDLRSHTRARVNFAAVGPREQAMMLGALGACGRENCSSHHLQEFAPVSIRMARDQQLPLNPEKLSGPCGRLLCCLQFEHTQYVELLREIPRKNAKVCVDGKNGEGSGACGKVVKLHPLQGTVDVYTDQGLIAEVPASELRPQLGSDPKGKEASRPDGPRLDSGPRR